MLSRSHHECLHIRGDGDCNRCETFVCHRCERRVSWDVGHAECTLCDDCCVALDMPCTEPLGAGDE